MGRKRSGEKRVQLNTTIPERLMKELDEFRVEHFSCDRAQVVEAALKKFLEEQS